MNERMQSSYTHIINLEFEEANKLLQLELQENFENRIIDFHFNYIDFLSILIGEEEKFFSIAQHSKQDRIYRIQKGDKNSPYYLYAQAEIHLQWAFARLKFEEYLTAAYEIQKAYSLLEENQELFPEFMLNKKGLGLLHALIGSIPEKYHWLLNMVGMEGSVEQGLGELKSLLKDESLSIYHNEILFITSFLQLNMTNNEVEYKVLLDLIEDKYTNNLLVNFAAARLSHSLGMNEFCIKVLESRPSFEERYAFYYLDYLLGMSYLYKLDFDAAKEQLHSFINNFKGSNYIKSAYHKLAWIAYLENDNKNKDTYLKKIIDNGKSSIDEDKVALRDASKDWWYNNYSTNSTLLRVRLLYDGGYYQKSLDEIQNKNSQEYSGFYDEYWYRLARIKSKLDYSDDEVVSHYQKSYDLGKENSSYFSPMSALQIGLIYEKQKKFVLAEKYFEKCLAMSNFDYERGIHQKAKTALKRVSD